MKKHHLSLLLIALLSILLSSCVESQETRITELEWDVNRIAALEKRIIDLEAQTNDFELRIADLEGDSDSKGRIDDLESQVSDLQDTMDKIPKKTWILEWLNGEWVEQVR